MSPSRVVPRLPEAEMRESDRLQGLYERLRERLLDLTNRNAMLNSRVSPERRSRRHVLLVNAALEDVYAALRADDAGPLPVHPLPEPDQVQADEQTDAFEAALAHARLTDADYLEDIARLDLDARDDDAARASADETLRLRLRASLDMPPRRKRDEIDRGRHALEHGIAPEPDLPLTSAHRLPLHLAALRFPDELDDLLERIEDTARIAMQETGQSTLYLAFGFLERPDADEPGKRYRAPLLLMPVRIASVKVGAKAMYGLVAQGGAETNLSLKRLLERDYRRGLPVFEAGDEESVATIGGYFDGVAHAIEGLKDWQIRPWLALGTFSFGRYQMFHDLAPENWAAPAVEHPLARAILAGTDQPGQPGEFAALPDYPIDAPDFNAIVPHLIAEADSSQHSALIDAAEGRNLVIEGPPGTGKSQTITNLIGHALGQGKRVLFLAEKQAALDVVRRRLDQAGLGAFCLDIHSEKSAPKAVISALAARADLGWGRAKMQPPAPDPALIEARHMIGRYLDGLHEILADGETPHRLIWQALNGMRGRESEFEALKRLAPTGDWIEDPAERRAMEHVVELYAMAATEFEARHGPVGASPWSRTGLGDVPQYDHSRLRASLSEWREPMIEALAMTREGAEFGIRTLDDLKQLVSELGKLGPITGAAFLQPLSGIDLAHATRAIGLLAEIARLEARLASTPDLVLTPRAATVRAAELVASRLGEALADRVPLDLERAIRTRVADTTELLAAIDGLMPAVAALGLDRDLGADRFADVARLTRALDAMTPARRAQLLAYRTVPEAEFAAVRARFRDLTDAFDDWRRHFPGLSVTAVPKADDVRAAAAYIRRGSVGRLLGGLNPEGRAARNLIGQLAGNAIPSRGDPALLEGLAGFIDYLSAFETDKPLRKLFGTGWQGLNTDFSGVETAIRLRRAFVQMVARATHGPHADGEAESLIATVFDLDEAGLATLLGGARAAERFLAIPTDVRRRLSAYAIGSAAVHLQAEVRVASALEDLAADGVLASIEHPLGVIAEYHHARERLGELKRELMSAPQSGDITAIVGGGDPAEAMAALLWIETVRATRLPEETKQALTGARAAEVYRILAGIMDRAETTLVRLDQRRREIEANFGWFNLDAGEPAVLVAQIDALLAHHAQLGDYLVLRRLKLEILSDGVGPFLDGAERLMLPMDTLLDVFRTLIAYRRAERARRASALREASGIELDVRRKIFAERDRARVRNDRMAIRDRLFERKTIPGNNVGPKSQWSEMALLNNEFQKSHRHLAVRALIARAGRSIQALTPCFLMSPIALAKFVPPGGITFDLVIIDEASQMRPEDALGGILRARQLVVVGDSKQLPPNDVFQRIDALPRDADEDEIIEESILEVCARSFGAVRRLKWHYRSRCESLIAFANREFYRDSLITFPARRPESFSIDLVRVDGLVRNRRNADEAAAVAEEAVRFMRHFAALADQGYPTLGIVTVNQDQRDLIFEELRRIATGDELVTRYQVDVEARGEPLFVKNIETVQGDERDYILASLVRGPQRPGGVVAQTFGALGGQHGGRRLNVLTTRARVRLVLFTSFGSADVKPSETSPASVHSLKRYLAYVEERGRLEAETVGGEEESPFEAEVAARLREAGFIVDVQVGVAQYRLDLAVRHPDRPESYLAGIECDGAQYHSAGSARDRDRLREEVLRELGWDLIRIWSTDWFADPREETRRLVRRLDLMRVVPDRDRETYRVSAVVRREAMAAATAAEVAATPPAQLALDLVPPEAGSAPSSGGAPAEEGETAAVSVEAEAAAPTGFAEAPVAYDAGGGEMSQGAVFNIGGWDPVRLRAALVAFRENHIRPAFPRLSPQRSILRDSLIDVFIHEYVIHPDNWTTQVPAYLRLNTNEAEVARFLKEICGIVARLG